MVKKCGRKIELGHIYHMHKAEPNVVALDKTSLASHTFITGSTGAGKSNTVYHLLDELDRQRVNFLVIEPAKGEYKMCLAVAKHFGLRHECEKSAAAAAQSILVPRGHARSGAH